MTEWDEQRDLIRPWLYLRCETWDEFQFWFALWDDLTDMYDYMDDFTPDRWAEVVFAPTFDGQPDGR